MAFPNGMSGYSNVLTTITQARKQQADFALWSITVLSVGLAVASGFVLLRKPSGWIGLGLQGGIFFCQSLAIGFTIGFGAGLKDADIEKRFPLVEVTTRHGLVTGLRMQQSSRTGYRFIKPDGTQCFIPTSEIKMISSVDSADPEERDRAS